MQRLLEMAAKGVLGVVALGMALHVSYVFAQGNDQGSVESGGDGEQTEAVSAEDTADDADIEQEEGDAKALVGPVEIDVSAPAEAGTTLVVYFPAAVLAHPGWADALAAFIEDIEENVQAMVGAYAVAADAKEAVHTGLPVSMERAFFYGDAEGDVFEVRVLLPYVTARGEEYGEEGWLLWDHVKVSVEDVLAALFEDYERKVKVEAFEDTAEEVLEEEAVETTTAVGPETEAPQEGSKEEKEEEEKTDGIVEVEETGSTEEITDKDVTDETPTADTEASSAVENEGVEEVEEEAKEVEETDKAKEDKDSDSDVEDEVLVDPDADDKETLTSEDVSLDPVVEQESFVTADEESAAVTTAEATTAEDSAASSTGDVDAEDGVKEEPAAAAETETTVADTEDPVAEDDAAAIKTEESSQGADEDGGKLAAGLSALGEFVDALTQASLEELLVESIRKQVSDVLEKLGKGLKALPGESRLTLSTQVTIDLDEEDKVSVRLTFFDSLLQTHDETGFGFHHGGEPGDENEGGPLSRVDGPQLIDEFVSVLDESGSTFFHNRDNRAVAAYVLINHLRHHLSKSAINEKNSGSGNADKGEQATGEDAEDHDHGFYDYEGGDASYAELVHSLDEQQLLQAFYNTAIHLYSYHEELFSKDVDVQEVVTVREDLQPYFVSILKELLVRAQQPEWQ